MREIWRTAMLTTAVALGVYGALWGVHYLSMGPQPYACPSDTPTIEIGSTILVAGCP